MNGMDQIPGDRANAKFLLDSSWADCKTTRKSTSSGLVFLNGALICSICRTQATVALSSCEAELYAANGLMVECIHLFRLCKFLCDDREEINTALVTQRLYCDSAAALAVVRRSGSGRLKHVQIKTVLSPALDSTKHLLHSQDQHQAEPVRLEYQTTWM